jgi:hypothetical protein
MIAQLQHISKLGEQGPLVSVSGLLISRMK